MPAPSDTDERIATSSAARADYLILLGILGLAAVVRFVGLEGRGTWDADQGHDMLVLRAFVEHGEIPLLGPPTSIGTFHHGALYYWLLAPAAWLTGSDPIGVTAAIAFAGLVTVAATWWLARQIGGPVAGHLAGLLTALSPAAIEQSTFIWNPNLIPAAAAIALACAWRAWSSMRPRWWVGAAAGVGVVMQCHILGVILLPPVLALLVADVRRRSPGERRPVLRAAVGGAVVVALMYVPLLVHELTHDFAETRAILAWLTSGGGAGPSFLERLPIVWWRVLAWPLAGLVTDRPVLAFLAAVVVVLALAIVLLRARGAERVAARWLGGTLVWSILALTVMAPSLATIIAGLPNDHYHAFADPAVLVIVALAVAALGRPAGTRIAAAAMGVGVLALEIAAFPRLDAWDGGWPAAARSAARIVRASEGRPVVLESLPRLKSPDAIGFPLARAGIDVRDYDTWQSAGRPADTILVILCDPLLEALIEDRCAGPAEDAVAGPDHRLIDRFDASPQRTISVYEAADAS